MRFNLLVITVLISFSVFGCSKASLIGQLKKAAATAAASGSSGSGVTAGQLTVQWTTPTQNTDNSALTNLVNCKVYYGLSSGGPYTSNAAAACATGAVNTKVITGLTTGQTYYFTVHAVNTSTNESADSSEVSAIAP